MKAFYSAFFFLLCFASPNHGFGQCDKTHHWESVVKAENIWKYYAGIFNPSANWFTPAFSDNTWNQDPGGYGDGDNGTII